MKYSYKLIYKDEAENLHQFLSVPKFNNIESAAKAKLQTMKKIISMFKNCSFIHDEILQLNSNNLNIKEDEIYINKLGLIRKNKKYSIEEVLEHVNKGTNFLFDNDTINMNNSTLINFKLHGTNCVTCGLKGKYFYKERLKEKRNYILHLYGIDKNGNEILMTKDHILPKSKKGSSIQNNYQTMCKICNENKSNKLEEIKKMNKINIIYDMETNDPDDYMTVCLLSTHPKVNLVAVTITPGSPEQVAIVKHVLTETNRTDVRVGVPDPKKFNFSEKNGKNSIISGFHYKIIPNLKPNYTAENSSNLLKDIFKLYPDATILTGAAVTNIAKFVKANPAIKIDKWVAQGGFAGCNIVEKENILKKFQGKETCRTFNFCQDIPAADCLLNSSNIKEKMLISKNVCHGITYDKEMHNKLKPYKDKFKGLELIWTAMDKYLISKPTGKMFHDPLAACVMLNPSICEFKEVEVYHKFNNGHQEFGSKEKKNTNTYISISVNKDLFFKTLIGS